MVVVWSEWKDLNLRHFVSKANRLTGLPYTQIRVNYKMYTTLQVADLKPPEIRNEFLWISTTGVHFIIN